jgi:hypothetical protein
MSGDKSLEEKLSDAMTSLEKTPNIWGTAPVEAEPEKWIDAWRVFKVVKAREGLNKSADSWHHALMH